jgi:tRNA (guanine37-N1)-methyltransferase
VSDPCTLSEFHFLTLFPQVIGPYMQASILGRAESRGLFRTFIHQLRDFATDAHKTVDDVAFGGGGGMVMKADVLAVAVESIRAQYPRSPSKVVYFTPRGKPMRQDWIEAWASHPTQWIFVCGHYEGVDQRFIDSCVDAEVSLGDFVLTGGELPALALADAMARQFDGTVKHEGGTQNESFSISSRSGAALLEYPQYTRPRSFRGQEVPEVLLSGNHKAIEQWRQEAAEAVTKARRPDLLQ